MAKKWWTISGILAAGVLAVLVLGIERGSAPALALFAGRFHPAVVHFPIALLLLAAAIELLAPRWSRAASARPMVPFIFLLGALSGLAAVVLGYLLSLGGGYEEQMLSLHTWMGLSVTVMAFGLALASAWWVRPGRVYRGMVGGLVLMVVVAGHFGSTLARGSGYLTYYLPEPVKVLVGIDGGAPAGLIADVDSARVFDDLVQPILERRCVTCHGPSKSKGNLRLDSAEGIAEGGRDGPALVAGHPAQSEIIRRITLPSYAEDAMPPDGGPPLDVGETEVIRWWIVNGASFDLRVAEIDETPTAVETFLARVSQPRAPRRSGIFALDVAEADSLDVGMLGESGLLLRRIDPQAPFLHVSATSIRDRFGDAEMDRLRAVAAQVAVLDVGHTRVSDDGAAVLAEMPHLTHLHLEGTGVGDAALRHLSALEHLEYLNLYGTAVSDAGLQLLQGLPALRAVYVWQSGVTEEGAAVLRRSGVEVNTGSSLAVIVPDSSAVRP